MSFLFSDNLNAALVAYIVKKYNEVSTVPLGRTILQKVCYFSKHNGVPLRYDFEIYNYGPYSQELYFEVADFKVDDLLIDTSREDKLSVYKPGKKANALIKKYQKEIDKYKDNIDSVISLFRKVKPVDFELCATVHYLYNSLSRYYSKAPDVKELIKKLKEIKGSKFTDSQIQHIYGELIRVGLIPQG